MKKISLLFLIPFITFCQEFYPGSLASIDEPICYQNTVSLSFDVLPSPDLEFIDLTWQKSWNGENWFTITNTNTTTYVTDSLFTDTYYRVNVNYSGVIVSTNEIIVNVLPPLNPGVLISSGSILNIAVDTLCGGGEDLLEFSIGASGAEWNWGGFLEFSYQWQQNNNISVSFMTSNDGVEEGLQITEINENDWINVGDNSNTHIPLNLDEIAVFRCVISSPYGCGSVFTDPVLIEMIDCINLNVFENEKKSTLILQTNILGQSSSLKNKLILNIYEDGSVEKQFVIN